MLSPNGIAVLVGAIAGMILGYLWYGPLFGHAWARLMGRSGTDLQERMENTKGKIIWSYALMFIGLVLMAFTLARIIALVTLFTGVSGVTAGLEAALLGWFGFIVPSSMTLVLWENRPWRLWLLNSGYYLVTLLLIGIIVGTWA